jgi:4-diphosphocytidyl-2-C-methyl-D-erythritol kinase
LPAVGSRSVIGEPARAKLNLYLHVLGRRDDGYHLLDSLVAFADIGDTLEVARADRLSLAVEGPFGAALTADTTENLVLRAGRLLAEAAGVPPHAALRLVKALPVASGIGGGSADAAATLRALCRLWAVSLPAAALDALALRLGADVPVCLAGVPAFMTGIGERIAPVDRLPSVDLVLVNPGLPLATATVFRALAGRFGAAVPATALPEDAIGLAAWLAGRRNDLTDAAIAAMPVIAEVLASLARQPGCLLARMSGSGATCFGLFASAPAAEQARAALTRPGWWVASGRLLGSGPSVA